MPLLLSPSFPRSTQSAAGATAKGANNKVHRNTLLKTGGGTHGGKTPVFDDEGFDFAKVFDLAVYDEVSIV